MRARGLRCAFDLQNGCPDVARVRSLAPLWVWVGAARAFGEFLVRIWQELLGPAAGRGSGAVRPTSKFASTDAAESFGSVFGCRSGAARRSVGHYRNVSGRSGPRLCGVGAVLCARSASSRVRAGQESVGPGFGVPEPLLQDDRPEVARMTGSGCGLGACAARPISGFNVRIGRELLGPGGGCGTDAVRPIGKIS